MKLHEIYELPPEWEDFLQYRQTKKNNQLGMGKSYFVGWQAGIDSCQSELERLENELARTRSAASVARDALCKLIASGDRLVFDRALSMLDAVLPNAGFSGEGAKRPNPLQPIVGPRPTGDAL